MLVLVGCVAVAIGAPDGRMFVNVIGIAAAFGAVRDGYGLRHRTRCQINPAVTIALVTVWRFLIVPSLARAVAGGLFRHRVRAP